MFLCTAMCVVFAVMRVLVMVCCICGLCTNMLCWLFDVLYDYLYWYVNLLEKGYSICVTHRLKNVWFNFGIACFSTHIPSSDHHGLLFGESKCIAVVYIKHIQIGYVLGWRMSYTIVIYMYICDVVLILFNNILLLKYCMWLLIEVIFWKWNNFLCRDWMHLLRFT
jgi:hypothetical protein